MRFRVGQEVWIGWHSDDTCHAKWARGEYGTIIDGPFPPGVYAPYRYEETNWAVAPHSGESIRAVESVLFPRDPGEVVELEKLLELTE